MKYRFSPSPNIKNCGVPSGGATSLHLAQYFAQRNRGMQYGYGPGFHWFSLVLLLVEMHVPPQETRASLIIHGLVAVTAARFDPYSKGFPMVFPSRTGEAMGSQLCR